MPHPITDEELSFLPSFVQAKVKRLADLAEYEQFAYHELPGTLDPAAPALNRISFWIASHDSVCRWLHIGGASVWIHPDNHYLHFDPLPAEFLPEAADQTTWWVLFFNEGEWL